MSLITKLVALGGAAVVANQGLKTLNTAAQNRQQAPPQPQYYPQQPPQHSGPWRDASGYMHQSWCNGQCGQHCNDQANQGSSSRNMGGQDYYNNNNNNGPRYNDQQQQQQQYYGGNNNNRGYDAPPSYSGPNNNNQGYNGSNYGGSGYGGPNSGSYNQGSDRKR